MGSDASRRADIRFWRTVECIVRLTVIEGVKDISICYSSAGPLISIQSGTEAVGAKVGRLSYHGLHKQRRSNGTKVGRPTTNSDTALFPFRGHPVRFVTQKSMCLAVGAVSRSKWTLHDRGR